MKIYCNVPRLIYVGLDQIDLKLGNKKASIQGEGGKRGRGSKHTHVAARIRVLPFYIFADLYFSCQHSLSTGLLSVQTFLICNQTVHLFSKTVLN